MNLKKRKNMTGQLRTTLLALVVVLLILLCAVMVVGCTPDDDDVMPAYTTILAEAITDHTGHITTLRDDNGRMWTVDNADTVSATSNTPDSIFRVKAWVVPEPVAMHLKVVQLDWIFSNIPQKYTNTVIKHDPVESVSASLTTRYINMRLGIKCTKVRNHRFGFLEESIIKNAEGSKLLTISLYHDAAGDAPTYTVEEVFSCPIYQYANILEPGRDKIKIVVHTQRGVFTKVWDLDDNQYTF